MMLSRACPPAQLAPSDSWLPNPWLLAEMRTQLEKAWPPLSTLGLCTEWGGGTPVWLPGLSAHSHDTLGREDLKAWEVE